MNKLKPIAARAAITLGMTLLWVEVSQFFLGGGVSPLIVAVVCGYGLTDRFISTANNGLKA